MARGGRRTYTRDANGRFASAPGGGGGKARRPAARKAVMRAGNRLTRDNRGRITSIGGDGATARGGRLRTASGGMRARQTAALRSTALRSGTIAKGGRGVSGSVARSLAAVKRGRQSGSTASPRASTGRSRKQVDEAKVSRIAERIRNLNAWDIKGKSSKARIKALNRSEAKQRAIEFLRGKKGVTQVTPAQVAKTINSRKPTSTGKSSGGVLRGRYDNLGQSRLRQQRSERMKSRFDSESISRRTKRVTEANAMNRGGLSSIKTSRASEIYSQQQSGRMRKERGAEMPYGIRNAANAEKRANQLRRAKAGAPLGGAASRMVGRIASGVVRSSRSKGQQLRKAKAAAERVKLRPMQRSEAAYQKRKYGVHSTIKNPGRMSQRLPRVTNSLGERVAVRGNKASTRQAYRTRVTATLNQSRTGSAGMGVMRKNPRMQKVKTGMTQLSLTGNNQDLVRFKQVKPRRR